MTKAKIAEQFDLHNEAIQEAILQSQQSSSAKMIQYKLEQLRRFCEIYPDV
jgi:hypothetical protein